MEITHLRQDKNKTIELDLPAGSLQCALYAFKGGADAVYLGLKEFSARKGAVNFSFEDLRKLKTLCLKENKKYYITLNTLVKDSQLPRVRQLLKTLEYVEPNGIIVQDLGIAKIIRDEFPSLELHGSTQLAVHNESGVRELQKLGFKRVVLSRELSFEEIKSIRENCPDVELKVFIHGAQCYGFSGLCLASQKITGRSANGGECAQICRTWFHSKETGEDKYFFSMKDMSIGEKVKDYVNLGLDSLKIEGRMKSPQYVYNCALYYSLLINGHTEDEDKVKWAKEAMEIAFSRYPSKGFFESGNSGSRTEENLIYRDFPSHLGVQVGTIEKVLQNKAVVKFSKPVALRDGLRVLFNGKNVGFSLTKIEGSRSFVSEDEVATINFPGTDFEKKPTFGTPVYCTSRHNGNLSLLNENIPLYKKNIDLEIILNPKTIVINNTSFDLELQEAKNLTNVEETIKKVFEASDKSYFLASSIKVTNNTEYGQIFIPISELKRIRREFYNQLDKNFEENIEKITENRITIESQKLPSRNLLGLWDSAVTIEGKTYLPLSPLDFNSQSFEEKMEKLTESCKALNEDLVIGLSNVGQIPWAKTHSQYSYFADFFLYTENSFSYQSLKEEIPSLIGSYELSQDTGFSYVGDSFRWPLFTSRVCFRRHSLGLPCKGCTRDNSFYLKQNDRSYIVSCKNCITVLRPCPEPSCKD